MLLNGPMHFNKCLMWLLRLFLCSCYVGTFIKQPSQGGPKGGPNGSLGVGCPNNNCGSTTAPVNVTAGTVCANGAAAVGGFSDGRSYCCPAATECIAHGQSSNTGPTPGRVVPVCLTGSAATVELCRRENDGLLSMVQVSRDVYRSLGFKSLMLCRVM